MDTLNDPDIEEVVEQTIVMPMEWEPGGNDNDVATLDYIDDELFIASARILQSKEDFDSELQDRLFKVHIDADDALAKNQNIDATLKTLQQYGLIVSPPSVSSLASLVADAMNRIHPTTFKIKVQNLELQVPPSFILLRRLSASLDAIIIVPSTRAATRIFRPPGRPVSCIGLLHVGNSFEQVSSYSPLILSETKPSRPRLSLPLLPPVTLEGTASVKAASVNLAVFRESARPNSSRVLPKDFDLKRLKVILAEEFLSYMQREVATTVKKMLAAERKAKIEQERARIENEAFEDLKA
ncbi:hypothetical protein BGZ83_003317, partial [Gryganskiella cystojenkinii]